VYKSPENTVESEKCRRKMKIECCGRVKEKVLSAGEPRGGLVEVQTF